MIGSASSPPSDRLPVSIDCSWAIFSKPPGFLRSCSQIAMALVCLSTRIIRQRSFSPYWASKAFFRSSGVTWTLPAHSFRSARAG